MRFLKERYDGPLHPRRAWSWKKNYWSLYAVVSEDDDPMMCFPLIATSPVAAVAPFYYEFYSSHLGNSAENCGSCHPSLWRNRSKNLWTMPPSTGPASLGTPLDMQPTSPTKFAGIVRTHLPLVVSGAICTQAESFLLSPSLYNPIKARSSPLHFNINNNHSNPAPGLDTNSSAIVNISSSSVRS
jgi:hypothetical protein